MFQGEQRARRRFLALNPNGKVPVLAEPREDGSLSRCSKSGAIMDFLARRHGAFGGTSEDQQAVVRQWLTFQMANCGPTPSARRST